MNFKKGMTLAETMLVFIIIGIIASLTISSMKPWEQMYKYLYSKVYNALLITIYNDTVRNSQFPQTVSDFCKGILYYVNTANNEDDSFCDGDIDLGNNPSEFNAAQSIKFSNGIRIWIGGDTSNEHKYFSYTPSASIGVVNYYLVYADLNGDQEPNSPEYFEDSISDIVAFAVTDKYTVVPLGYPEVDLKYIQAHLVTPSENDEEGSVVSDPMTYYEAKIRAFGNPGDSTHLVSSSEPMSMDIQSQLPEGSPFRLDYSALGQNFVHDERCIPEGTGNSEPVCKIKINEYY